MQPIYSTNQTRNKRPRKTIRPLGMISRELKADVEKYGINKLSTGLLLISLGVDMINLNIR